MRARVTSYRIELRLVDCSAELRVAHGTYREVREVGVQGEPGRMVSRALFRLVLDGKPAWASHRSLEAAVGGPYTVAAHARVDGPRGIP